MEANLKASELRIGNFMIFAGCICKILEIKRYTLMIEFVNKENENFIQIKYDDSKPIPLTMEILLACGLKKCGGGYSVYDKYSYIFMGIRHFNLKISENNITYQYPPMEVKYLHQLQNLYFALTGEELTIDISQSKPTE